MVLNSPSQDCNFSNTNETWTPQSADVIGYISGPQPADGCVSTTWSEDLYVPELQSANVICISISSFQSADIQVHIGDTGAGRHKIYFFFSQMYNI
jgi:hypothetical protein